MNERNICESECYLLSHQAQCTKIDLEYEATRNELSKVSTELEALLAEKNLVSKSEGDAESKYKEMAAKYESLSKEHQKLVKSNEDVLKVNADQDWLSVWRIQRPQEMLKTLKLFIPIQVCKQRDGELKKLETEKESIQKGKLQVETEFKELNTNVVTLKKEV